MAKLSDMVYIVHLVSRDGNVESPVALLPCPFCGRAGKMYNLFSAERFMDGEPSYVVGCCECKVSPRYGGNTPEDAAEVWNKRVKGDEE
jgi:hypothetical protein